ncbi:hypothetical protein DL96DRAFT_1822122 [Flagelloscypha sp. PMI_526]|nr:hypothetical protein DL96DRAFT_1822122 [Flagelloscypha sp. PMI_526]
MRHVYSFITHRCPIAFAADESLLSQPKHTETYAHTPALSSFIQATVESDVYILHNFLRISTPNPLLLYGRTPTAELATVIPEFMLDGSMESNASPTTIAEDPSSPSTSHPPIQQTPARSADLGVTGEAQSAGRLNMFGLGSLDALPPASPIPPTIPSSVAAYTTNNAPSSTNDGGNTSSGTGGAKGQVMEANNAMILRKSVEYVRYLQQLISVQGARNRELGPELRTTEGQGGDDISSGGGGGSFAGSGTMGPGFGINSNIRLPWDDVGVNSRTTTLKPDVVKLSPSVGGEEGLSPLTGSENGREGVKLGEEASIGDQAGI